MFYSHFPEDRNCEICHRTKIIRAPCRRRNGRTVHRAEIFGDLITADHKVLSDNCESRNNHRYAVVVQDLATQWIQAYPCKTKTSGNSEKLPKVPGGPTGRPKVIYTDNSLEFGRACEDLSWNHCTSTPHRSETKWDCWKSSAQSKGRHPLPYCCNRVWMKVGGQILWNVIPICETSQIYYLMGRRPMRDALGNHLQDRLFHLVHWLSITYNCEGTVKNPSILKESLTWIVPRIRIVRGVNLEGWCTGCRHWRVGNGGCIWNLLKKTQCERGDISQTRRIYFVQSQMDEPNPLEEIKTWEHPLWYGSDQFKESVTLIFMDNQKGLFHHLTTRFWMPVKR